MVPPYIYVKWQTHRLSHWTVHAHAHECVQAHTCAYVRTNTHTHYPEPLSREFPPSSSENQNLCYKEQVKYPWITTLNLPLAFLPCPSISSSLGSSLTSPHLRPAPLQQAPTTLPKQ